MATFTANKGYALPNVGGDIGVWGPELNQTISTIDLNVGGFTSINMAGGVNVTASAAQAQNLVLNLTGAITASVQLILPPLSGMYIIANNTTGNFTVTAITSMVGAVGVGLTQGAAAVLYCDGTNIQQAVSAGVGPINATTGTFTGTVTAPSASFGAGTFTGAMIGTTAQFSGAVTAGKPNVVNIGTAVLTPGDASHPGYVGFFNAAGTRVGYCGWSNGSNNLLLDAENGYTGWSVLGGFFVSSQSGALVNSTITINPSGSGIFVNSVQNPSAPFNCYIGNIATPASSFCLWQAGGVTIGGIASTSGANGVVYNTTSDQRLKLYERPIGNSGWFIDQLKALWFRWKSAPDADPEPGFFAQQVFKVFPWAVTKSKGRIGSKNFRPWQMDASKMMPIVIAELQDLRKRVKELENLMEYP